MSGSRGQHTSAAVDSPVLRTSPIAGDSDAGFLHLLKDVAFRPVFIIGDHRSGTTLLYKILADTQCFHVLTAYHVIYYDRILANHCEGREAEAQKELAERFVAAGLGDRIIDNVPVRPNTPEEYGFVLEDSRRPHVRPENRDRMVEICRKLRFTGAGDKPVLLKNPWDVLSFVTLRSCFPDARFVFLHRHPLAVINSQLRAIRSLIRERNEYTALLAKWYARMLKSPAEMAWMRLVFASALPLWKGIVPKHVLRANKYGDENIGQIPAADRISLRYEDLCREPRQAIERLLDFLGVSPAVNLPYESMIAPRDPEVLPEIEQARKGILKPFRPYLNSHGYND
jgi:hypothetical protein